MRGYYYIMSNGFFSRVKGNLIKWWQLIVLPVLKINNNASKKSERYVTQESKDDVSRVSSGSAPISQNETDDSAPGADEDICDTVKEPPFHGEDALEVLNRINQEKEEERRREIEQGRQKAQERERIASIMNANKVDVNAFIAAGKAAVEASGKKEEEQKKEEDERRAREIIDRLNREAAEDEAKKQAEIEEAKKRARETF